MKWTPLVLVVVAGYLPGVCGAVEGDGLSVPVVFMEPVGGEGKEETAMYNAVTDAERIAELRGWMKNDAGRWALGLYERAWRTMEKRGRGDGTLPPYHIALVPGGNHAASGFKLKTDGAVEDHLTDHYIKLAPQEYAFDITFAHETGHVVLGVLSDGKGVPTGPARITG